MVLDVDGGEDQRTDDQRALVAEVVPRENGSLHVDGIRGLFLTHPSNRYTQNGHRGGRGAAVSHPENEAPDHGAQHGLRGGHADVAEEHDHVTHDGHVGNGDVQLLHHPRVHQHVLDGAPQRLQNDHGTAGEHTGKQLRVLRGLDVELVLQVDAVAGVIGVERPAHAELLREAHDRQQREMRSRSLLFCLRHCG